MNIRQVPVVTAEAVLCLAAGVLVFFCLGLVASLVGLPLVPLLVPAVVALILLARRLHQGHWGPVAKS